MPAAEAGDGRTMLLFIPRLLGVQDAPELLHIRLLLSAPGGTRSVSTHKQRIMSQALTGDDRGVP